MIEALIILVIIGVVLYLIETFIPMSEPIKMVIRIVVVLLLCIWLLNLAGITNFNLRS